MRGSWTGSFYRRVGSITPANAEAVAARHGIKLDIALKPDAEEYASSVRAVADGTEVAATVFGISQSPRIVSLMGYKIDLVPTKSSLLMRYEDAPGASASSAPCWAMPM